MSRPFQKIVLWLAELRIVNNKFVEMKKTVRKSYEKYIYLLQDREIDFLPSWQMASKAYSKEKRSVSLPPNSMLFAKRVYVTRNGKYKSSGKRQQFVYNIISIKCSLAPLTHGISYAWNRRGYSDGWTTFRIINKLVAC